MKPSTTIWAAAALLLGLGLLPAEGGDLTAALKPAIGERDIGIIFDVSNILMDLESHQGGVGLKLGTEKHSIRYMLDLLIYKDFNPAAIWLGVCLEKHFFAGRITPYWGGLVQTGYILVNNVVDRDNWQRETTLPLTLGAVLGIEVFVFEFLSLFAEYTVSVSVDLIINRLSTGGVVDTSADFTYSLDLGMGNKSKIGVVLYFNRRPQSD